MEEEARKVVLGTERLAGASRTGAERDLGKIKCPELREQEAAARLPPTLQDRAATNEGPTLGVKSIHAESPGHGRAAWSTEGWCVEVWPE